MGILNDFRRAIAKRRVNPEQAYLEEATSLVDLELRHREIDRGRFRRR
jgi:hypothetical protein